MKKFIFFLICISFLFITATSFAESPLPGPYPATVISVTDGDTVRVRVQLWLGLYKEVTVRIRDIDTPEISKAKCAKEKEFGQKAKDFLKGVLPPESKVKLTKVTEDKYRGRVDAFLQTTDGVDISELLLKERLASPNKGGKKQNWCGPESQEEQVSQSKPRRDIEVDSR